MREGTFMCITNETISTQPCHYRNQCYNKLLNILVRVPNFPTLEQGNDIYAGVVIATVIAIHSSALPHLLKADR